MHNQHATQCTTLANMHSHMEEGCFPEEKNVLQGCKSNRKFYKGENQK